MEAGVGVGEGGGRKSGLPSKKWLRQHRTILLVDESGFYLLPHVGRTWAPRIEEAEKWIHLATFSCSVASLVLFTAPAAHHRLGRPLVDKVRFKLFATQMIVVD